MRISPGWLCFNLVCPVVLLGYMALTLRDLGLHDYPQHHQLHDVEEACQALGVVDTRVVLMFDYAGQQMLNRTSVPLVQKMQLLYDQVEKSGVLCFSEGMDSWREHWAYNASWLSVVGGDGSDAEALGLKQCKWGEGRMPVQSLSELLQSGMLEALLSNNPGRLLGNLHMCLSYRRFEWSLVKAQLGVAGILHILWLLFVIVKASRSPSSV